MGSSKSSQTKPDIEQPDFNNKQRRVSIAATTKPISGWFKNSEDNHSHNDSIGKTSLHQSQRSNPINKNEETVPNNLIVDNKKYNKTIVPLTVIEVENYKMVTLFDEGQIQQLYTKYKMIDSSEIDFIKREDVFLLDEFRYHPLQSRLLDVLSLPEIVTFEQFVKSLSVFSSSATKDEKLRFAFRLWDTDGDGLLSSIDLSETIGKLCGGSLSEDDMDFVVGKILSENTTPSNSDGSLTLDAFQRMTADTDVIRRLTFQML